MVGIVQGRADEFRKACIDNEETLRDAFLHVKHTGNERTALCHYATTQFEVKGLTLAQTQVVGEGLEVGLEVGDGVGVGAS